MNQVRLLGRPLDRILTLSLAAYGCLVLVALLVIPRHYLPAEDAVILHQYSTNLAKSGAITYYPGGPHTEGATDFGWMLLLAGFIRLGFSPILITSFVNFISLALLAYVLVRLAQVRHKLLGLLIVAGCAGLFPQILAALSGFAVLPEALLLLLLVASFLQKRVALTAALALVLCLLRPDGVLFSVPLLCYLFAQTQDRRRLFWTTLVVFILPWSLYWIWRTWYFQELFPLPFLVKSQAARFAGVLVTHSVLQSAIGLIIAAAVWTVLRLTDHRVQPALVVSLVILPTVFYWAMRLDQNVGDRFFFYLPCAAAVMIAVCWGELEEGERRMLLRCGAGISVLFLLGPLLREVRTFRDYQFRSTQAIAEGLRWLPFRGTLLTSEAGYLEYDSDWVAYDAWGLNTARFAKQFVRPYDVGTVNPDLIVLHPDTLDDCVPVSVNPDGEAKRTWPNMLHNVAKGAQETGKFELWLIPYGSDYYRRRKHWNDQEGDRECFFVNRTSRDFEPLVRLILANHGHRFEGELKPQ